MNWIIFRNDLVRNKGINLALLLFMMFSATLAILSVLMGVQTFTAISGLYKSAEPPHFMQMHKGEFKQSEIDQFMSQYEGVTYWQTDTMINVYGESITVVNKEKAYDLADCRLDIGLVKQNQTKDLLLNARHEPVTLQEGEIGIPILLREMYGMEIGDQVSLEANNLRKELVITEFILDSMMNSPMASSTRLLLSDEDYDKLQGWIGEKEY